MASDGALKIDSRDSAGRKMEATPADHLGEAATHVRLMPNANDPLCRGFCHSTQQIVHIDPGRESLFDLDGNQVRPDLIRDDLRGLLGPNQRAMKDQLRRRLSVNQELREFRDFSSAGRCQRPTEVGSRLIGVDGFSMPSQPESQHLHCFLYLITLPRQEPQLVRLPPEPQVPRAINQVSAAVARLQLQ